MCLGSSPMPPNSILWRRPGNVASVSSMLKPNSASSMPVADAAKFRPQTRGTADHSLPICLAMTPLDGDVTLGQFDRDRWRDRDAQGFVLPRGRSRIAPSCRGLIHVEHRLCLENEYLRAECLLIPWCAYRLQRSEGSLSRRRPLTKYGKWAGANG